MTSDNRGYMQAPAPPDLRDFVMVAHMYWSLVFAFVGGWVSLLMYWTGPEAGERILNRRKQRQQRKCLQEVVQTTFRLRCLCYLLFKSIRASA